MTRDSRKRSYAAKLGYCTKRVYDSFFSSRTTVEAGRNWYPKAFEIAGNIHQSPIAGAGVIAALSPRCAWKTNLSNKFSHVEPETVGKTFDVNPEVTSTWVLQNQKTGEVVESKMILLKDDKNEWGFFPLDLLQLHTDNNVN